MYTPVGLARLAGSTGTQSYMGASGADTEPLIRNDVRREMLEPPNKKM